MSELSSGEHAGGEGQARKRRVTRRPNRRDRSRGEIETSRGDGVKTDDAPRKVSAGRKGVSQEQAGTSRPPHNGDARAANNSGRKMGGMNHGIRRQGNRNRKQGGVYAALDLGTNNCRLLMAVPRAKGRFKVIDGYSKIVRLGEGLAQSGRLRDEAMDRAIDALSACAAKIGNRTIRRMRLIATEACRRAANGEEFLDRVKEHTGLELEIVDRETEARLAAQGCGILMDRKCKTAIMFDIGGGSTELVILRGQSSKNRRVSERIEDWTSLPMGVVTLAEKFGGKEVERTLFNDMVDHVCEEMHEFANRQKIEAGKEMHLLGTSGTVTTVAGLHLGLQRYERRKVDGLWLNGNEIDQVIDQLLEMDYEARRKNPCIGTERADLVMAGCAILEGIRKLWPAERLRVADRGLREGLLTEMMDSDFAWRRRGFRSQDHSGRADSP